MNDIYNIKYMYIIYVSELFKESKLGNKLHINFRNLNQRKISGQEICRNIVFF